MLAFRKSWALALIAAVASVSPARALITYNVDLPIGDATMSDNSIGNVSGDIVTDGNLGPLGASDIVSYNLLLTDYNSFQGQATFTLSNTNRSVALGSGLSASLTSLTFDFSDPSDVFYISTIDGPFGPGLCFQASTYGCNWSFYPPPGEAIEIGRVPGDPLPFTPLSGTVVIATTGVPEPSTWAMMLLGFAGLGYAGYRRTIGKATTAPATA